MGNGKINKLQLSRMLRSGKSGKECSKVFGVTEGAISQARKELNIAVVKSVALETAHHVVDQNLNAVDQLQKINSYANELLDLLMAWNRGDKGALQVLESQVKKVRVKGKEEEVMELKFKDPRELALRAMAEIRGQLSLQLEIFKTLYDLEAVADFQREVLTAIGEASKDVRERVVQRLKERRALRGSVSIN
jgi:hypothetical protein